MITPITDVNEWWLKEPQTFEVISEFNPLPGN
jgi:hypothetical protein